MYNIYNAHYSNHIQIIRLNSQGNAVEIDKV